MELPTKMTLSRRVKASLAYDALRMIEFDLHDVLRESQTIPDGWNEIATDPQPTHPKKVKVTLWVDADVLRAFKGLGRGYQTRMNRVLRAWMLARAARLVKGPDTTDYILYPERIEELVIGRRPEWGDSQDRLDRAMEEIAERERARNGKAGGEQR